MSEMMTKPNRSISIDQPAAAVRRRRQESRLGRAARWALCSAALALAIGAPARASTYTVLNTDDAGPGSLRQAVLDANSNAGADAIDFAAGIAGTIDLGDELTITDSLTITGPGADQLTIDGGGEDRIFNIDGSAGSIDVSISGLTLTNGRTPADQESGGAIVSSQANLSLTDVTVSKSGALSSPFAFGVGGGIAVTGGGSISPTVRSRTTWRAYQATTCPPPWGSAAALTPPTPTSPSKIA